MSSFWHANPKSAMARRRKQWQARAQRGLVLLGLLVILTMATLFFFVDQLSPEKLKDLRQTRTSQALAEATEAVLGYAVRFRAEIEPDQMPGYLLLPDLGTAANQNLGNPCQTNPPGDPTPIEGCDAANFAGNAQNVTAIGRLPWRVLKLPPLTDGAAECLWLVVAGSHQRVQKLSPMNWDTPGQLDLVNTNLPYAGAALAGHDRPVAIVIAPGRPLLARGADAAGNTVTQCGGNYLPGNYLELTNLGPFDSSAQASGDTSAQPKPVYTRGRLTNGAALVANDVGIAITPDMLYSAIVRSSGFRTEINAMLDNIQSCVGNDIAAGNLFVADANNADLAAAPADKVAIRLPANACYDDTRQPLNYYTHWRRMFFLARPNVGFLNVNGENCSAVVLFSNQRAATQQRLTDGPGGQQNDPGNYLETTNLANFTGAGINFSGPTTYERPSPSQSRSQDIVRCVQQTFTPVQSGELTAAGLPQLAVFNAASRTLTLGQTVAAALNPALANDLFGCAWAGGARAFNDGLRTYFRFRINDGGFSFAPHEGITFAIVDGDANGAGACGGASKHIGYSGNNLVTPFIAQPKIGIEIDSRSSCDPGPCGSGFNFNPYVSNSLSAGANDPSYTGGHVGIVYWGGETAIAGSPPEPPCIAPRYEIGGLCYLPQEEDDNVHGQTPAARSGFPPPPANPASPPPPPTAPAGVYKLDPSLSSVPVNLDFHVRVEARRTSPATTFVRARVATTGNIDLAAPGASIDGVYLFGGDRILVKDQTATAQNGIYTWQSANTTLVRAYDADSAEELSNLIVSVDQGLAGGNRLWRQTEKSPSVGSSTVRWARVGIQVASSGDLTLSSPGATIDGILMQVGELVLVKDQTVAADNGIYTWNGASSAMTRTAYADTAAKLTGMAVYVRKGSEAGAWWSFDGSTWTRRSQVRVATQANLALAAPGAAIDGIAMAAGDRVLVRAQAAAAENGIYTWTGAATAMTRATTAAALANAIARVSEGTQAGYSFQQNAFASSATLDTDPVAWSIIESPTKLLLEAWILPDSPNTANQIAAMKNTTRPMSQLYPTFTPHLRDTPLIPYPLRNVRLGFTTGQRTSVTDQNFTVSDYFTSWID